MPASPAADEARRRPGEEPAAGRIGLVLDSTALLNPDERERVEAGLGGLLAVVPLTVLVDDEPVPDGQLPPERLCEAMESGSSVSTSMPAAADFAAAFSGLAERGAEHIVVLTLSGALSGTCAAAQAGAEDAAVPVTVIDSRTASAAVGGAALLIAEGAAAGRGPAELSAAAEDYLREETLALFCPATLTYLQRGGRIGRAASLVGRALAIVPVLTLADGVVDSSARVRTVRKAHQRMSERAEEFASGLADRCELVLLVPEGEMAAAPQSSRDLLALLEETARTHGWGLRTGVLSAVLTAHVGPGAVGLVVRAQQ
ncbi:DegV family protein [Brevibacterium album]|uniref:DegV family protein n=1 Tax=Brevibacterium album TaxID=417948 RepID=UPI000415E959|nr:DegV family protein [Brevibacterium album]